jgi:hypothetical protein
MKISGMPPLIGDWFHMLRGMPSRQRVHLTLWESRPEPCRSIFEEWAQDTVSEFRPVFIITHCFSECRSKADRIGEWLGEEAR